MQWLVLPFLLFASLASQAKTPLPLEGSWTCPSTLAISMLGQPIEVTLNSQNLLTQQGRFASRGQASVNLGFMRPTVNAQSQGRWQREGEHLILEVEQVTFTPSGQAAVQMQYALISQLEALLPPMPHRQKNKILLENLDRIVIEDPQGQRYQCNRQP
ncbi:hypothetical protein P8S54_05220 [Thiomicrospira sp. R3]|uniref:hypothetical protein n=1 Tax=Thiomicrospira sp. R3 TaxID=3035472 RepID=UPI00259AF545|nr:hypothetical protein [Thiomicrospira sp. R3]WFE69704.1 hypothetical protein P8S54_05220 [Thiomicrospira sp. R3]